MANDPLVDAIFGSTSPSGPDPLSSSFVDSIFGIESRVPEPEPLKAEEPSALREFGKGVQAGVKSLGGQFTAAGGVAAQIFGAEETARGLFKSAQETEREIQQELPQAVRFDQAFDSPGNFVIWLSRMTGEQVPVLASILVGGGLGGVVGRLVGQGVIRAVEANTIMARGGALASQLGTVAGAVAVSTGFETGVTASEQFGVMGEVQPGVTLAAGVAKGALEVVVPFGLAKVLGISSRAAGGVLDKVADALTGIQSRTLRAGVALATAAPLEGATELLQEAIDIGVRGYVDENFDTLGAEAAARLLESATTGFFVGAVFGGAAGGLSKRPVDDLEVEDFDPGRAQPTEVVEEPTAAVEEPTVDVVKPETVVSPITVDVAAPVGKVETAEEKFLRALGSEETVAEFKRLNEKRNSPDQVVAVEGTAEFEERFGELNNVQKSLLADIVEEVIIPQPVAVAPVAVVPEVEAVTEPKIDDTAVVVAELEKAVATQEELRIAQFEAPQFNTNFKEASETVAVELNKFKSSDFAALVNSYNRELAEQSEIVETDISPASKADYWEGFDKWFAGKVIESTQQPEGKALTSLEKSLKRLGNELKGIYNGNIEQLAVDVEQQSATANVFGNIVEPHLKLAARVSAVDNVQPLRNLGLNPANIPHSQQGDKIDKVLSRVKIPKGKRRELRALNDRYSWLHNWGFNIIQLAKRNPHIRGLVEYVEWMDQWYNEKMGIISQADEHVRSWKASMSVKMQDRFAKFILEMDQMVYRSRIEIENNVERWPTDEEFGALVKKHKLSREAVEVYRVVRDDFAGILTSIEEASVSELERTITDAESLTREIAATKADMNKLRQRPYFPHSRFGNYALIVTREEGGVAYFEQFETKEAAHEQIAAVRKEFPEEEGFNDVGLRLIPKEVQSFRGMPPQLLAKMKADLRTNGLLDKDLEFWLDNFAADFLPSRSFRKRLLRRKNTPGFSVDALRSYASYMRSAASHVARMKLSGVMDQTIIDMQTEMKELTPGTDVTKRSGIISFVERHKEEIMNPKPDWAEARSVAFIWYLGFVPASAALNLTQVPMVAAPYLADRFSTTKAIAALTKAVLSVHKTYQNKTEDVTDFELQAFTLAMSQGFINESMATELAGTADGGNMARIIPGSPIQKFIAQTAHWSAFLFHHSEQLNRRVVFRAGLDLAMQNPNAKYLDELQATKSIEYGQMLANGFSPTQARAYLAGKDAVIVSQFEYAAHARSRFMSGRKGIIFTFFMFQQNMVFFALKSPGAAKYWMMMLMAAGLMGLPGAEDLVAVTKFMAREMFGSDFDPERELRKFSLELLGDDIAPDVMLNGLSRIGFGMSTAADILGVPFPTFDFSANMSMGQIIPGLQEIASVGGDFETKFARATTDAAGATLGIGINLMKAITDDDLPAGDMKRWERAMPRALRNMSKALRFLQEGRERNRSGATVAEFDASDSEQVTEIFAQLMGFTPTRLSRIWDRNRMLKEAEMYWSSRRNTLLKQFDHAGIIGDKGARGDVLAKIRQYNKDVPFGTMAIRQRHLRASVKARNRSRRLQEAGIPATKGLRPLAGGIRALFPEVEEDTEAVPSGR